MYKTIKSLLIPLVAVAMTACRTAKPSVSSETTADSLSTSKEYLSVMSHDSISLSEESKTLSYDRIEFIESGGYVSLSADGSISLSGVAEVKSSRLRTEETKTEGKSLSGHSHSKEAVAERHQAASVSESHTDSSGSRISWKLKATVVLITLLILLILITIRKLSRFLN